MSSPTSLSRLSSDGKQILAPLKDVDGSLFSRWKVFAHTFATHAQAVRKTTTAGLQLLDSTPPNLRQQTYTDALLSFELTLTLLGACFTSDFQNKVAQLYREAHESRIAAPVAVRPSPSISRLFGSPDRAETPPLHEGLSDPSPSPSLTVRSIRQNNLYLAPIHESEASHLQKIQQRLDAHQEATQKECKRRTPEEVDTELQACFLNAQIALNHEMVLQDLEITEPTNSVSFIHLNEKQFPLFYIEESCKIMVGDQSYPVHFFVLLEPTIGLRAAHFLKNNLIPELLNAIKRHKLALSGIWNAINQTFLTLNERFIHENRNRRVSEFSQETIADHGCSVNLTLLIDSTLWNAHVGKMQAVLTQDLAPVQLSENPDPSKERFAERVKAHGGEVINGKVDGQWESATTFGNAFLYGAASAKPSILRVELDPSKPNRLFLGTAATRNIPSRQLATWLSQYQEVASPTLANSMLKTIDSAESAIAGTVIDLNHIATPENVAFSLDAEEQKEDATPRSRFSYVEVQRDESDGTSQVSSPRLSEFSAITQSWEQVERSVDRG